MGGRGGRVGEDGPGPPGGQGVAGWFFRRAAQADELAADIAYELATQLGAVNLDGPFVAGMSLLQAWSTAQDSGPVAVLVEDLHWADSSSSQALLSAVKRLDRDRVLVLITSRGGASVEWERFVVGSERCHRLVLADFTVDEVAALAAAKGVELTHRQAARLHAHTRGHPLYVRTLLSELSASQLRAVRRLTCPPLGRWRPRLLLGCPIYPSRHVS